MKELLMQYAAYNMWANQKLCETVLALPAELQQQEVSSSFTSLRGTILHMWDAQSIWWQRLKLQENVLRPSDTFSGTTEEAVQAFLQQTKQWETWITNASDMQLQHVFSYYNTKREQFKQPTYQVLMHMMTHDAYHRGQLVNMLRQVGHQKIPQTDFIVWTRKK
jgi:uncharacterized damage-inducible protein DinB